MADKVRKEKIFLNAMDSWFSNFFIETFRTDHIPESKYQTEIMGTLNDKINGKLPLYFEPKIINFDFNPSYKSDIFQNDIIIYNLNTGNIREITYIIKGLKFLRLDSEKVLIIISNLLTWGKTGDKLKTDDPNEIIFTHPDDIKVEKNTNIEDNEKNENLENNEGEEQKPDGENANPTTENNKDEKNNTQNEEKKDDEKKLTDENNENANLENQNVEDTESKKKLNIVEEEENKPIIVYYTENDYLKRKPIPKYLEYKYVENEALSLNGKANIKTYVVCPGIVFGYGEKTFYSIFKNALLNLPIEEILLDKGRNIIPTIHMKDLINIISKIIEKKPNSHYLLAFDQSNNKSLKNIVKSIYNCVGDESKMILPKEEEKLPEEENNENNENAEQENKNEPAENNKENQVAEDDEKKEEGTVNNESKKEESIISKKKNIFFTDKKYILQKYFPRELLTLDLKLLSSDFLKGEPKKNYYDSEDNLASSEPTEYTPLFKWHCPFGIFSNLQAVRREFIKYRNLNGNKVMILGNPYTGKTTISEILSKIFHLPILNSQQIVDFGKKIASEDVEEKTTEKDPQTVIRKNSIEKDLIRDINKTLKELEEGYAAAEEAYNKRPNKKKTDPPFDEKSYYRFNDEMMVRMLKRRLLENDTTVYGYILDGFPKNYNQALELFEDLDKSNLIPNSVIIFDNVEDDFAINRLKNDEKFPKDAKDPQAAIILERANRRLNKIKEEKAEPEYKSLHDYFSDEKNKNYFNVLNVDGKKEIIEIIKECQEFIIKNNDNIINQIDKNLDCHDYEYDYIKICEEEERRKKEEEEKLNNENNPKPEEKVEEQKENLNEQENPENVEKKEEKEETSKVVEENTEIKKEPEEETEQPKSQLEIEKENEIKLLEKKSEVLRRYLAENVLPLLSLGILHVANERPDDPVEALADYLLEKSFELEKNKDDEKKEKKDDNKEKSDDKKEKDEENSKKEDKKEVKNNNNENNDKKEGDEKKVSDGAISPINNDEVENAEGDLDKAMIEEGD